jgi:hypothetical protein
MGARGRGSETEEVEGFEELLSGLLGEDGSPLVMVVLICDAGEIQIVVSLGDPIPHLLFRCHHPVHLLVGKQLAL